MIEFGNLFPRLYFCSIIFLSGTQGTGRIILAMLELLMLSKDAINSLELGAANIRRIAFTGFV